jgi:hypothetical protein
MFRRTLLLAEEALPAGAGQTALERLGPLGRMRLAVSWSLLIFVVCFLLLIVAYLCRVWRRTVRRPLPPTPFEEDAWARKPLVQLEEEDEDDEGPKE